LVFEIVAKVSGVFKVVTVDINQHCVISRLGDSRQMSPEQLGYRTPNFA
jgi:hypothetical protein